jgi:chromosome segregation ATPase
MNLVGKILTMLVFVMSVVFASFAVAVFGMHKNYKDSLMNAQEKLGNPVGVKKRLEDAKKRVEDLNGQRSLLTAAIAQEKALKLQQLLKLENELAKWKAAVEKGEDQVAELNKQLRQSAIDSTTAHEDLDKRTQQAAQRRAEMAKVIEERKALIAKSLVLTEALHDAVSQRMTLQDRGRLLEQEQAAAADISRY